MFGFKFLGKTHVPHNKNTAELSPVKMTPPKEVLLPMSQHIGAPATPIVKVGDEVKVGQLIAEPTGYVSSPIYSSVSGKVTKIESYLLSDGREVSAVRIESDGLMTPYDKMALPNVSDFDSFIEAVKASGLVGLGGAGFPASVKLEAARKGSIDTIIINGAECEPYITSDTRTMIDQSFFILEGIKLLERFIPGVKKFVFGIESNKPKCIEEMKRVFRDNPKVFIAPLPSLYPQGAEKVLIYNTVRRVVPDGKLPADMGVLVINVTSLAFLGQFIGTGMPLVEKCVTVDGSAVNQPKNLIVPIGTPIKDVLDFAGVNTDGAGKVLLGGPMMGVAVCSLDQPVDKRTNALTVISKEEAISKREYPCIHCGRCVQACPMGLNPTAFVKAMKMEDKSARAEALAEANVFGCMECGCCSFVCPSRRPLAENNKLAKADLKSLQAKKN